VKNLEKQRKCTSSESKKKIAIRALSLLGKKSLKAIETAKKLILDEKIESEVGHEALTYYVKNWNDIVHPGILALACEAIGGNAEEALPMQVVVLYLAAATDLHDDIIDGSKVKNDKLTVFGKYGKDIALLLGNAMMIKGFILLYDYGKNLDPVTFKNIVHIIKTDLFDLGNAHLREVDLKGKIEVSPESYMQILEKKASIIRVNAKIGAVLGGGSPEEVRALARYGEILGMLLELREEFIDTFEPKELENRMKNEILPLPILLTFKNPKTKRRILNILSKPKISEDDAQVIVEYIFKDRQVKKLREHMQKLGNEALKIVSTIRKNRAAEDLDLLIRAALEDI